MSKQSSIEQKAFKSSLDLLLYYLPSAIRGQFKEQIKQAKAMHKKEIEDAYIECWMNDGGNGFHKVKEAEQYYNETFGGEQC